MTLKIQTAEYVISAPSLKEAPDWTLPEVAMVGRSNVGKSSFINMVTGRKKLAQTSNTPGKTRLINFYRINDNFALVDLPGYGYAKVSKAMQSQWQRHLQQYLRQRKNLVLVIQLVDARHGLQDSDRQMLEWLHQQGLSVLLVLTKADKLSRNELAKQVQQTARELGVAPDEILTVSAATGWGKETFLSFLKEYLQTVAQRPALG